MSATPVDPVKHKISSDLLKNGDVYIEVYPMVRAADGDTITSSGQEPDYYDVWLRPDDWDMNKGSCYGEWDYLTLDDTNKIIEDLRALNPDIVTCWVEP